MQLLNLRFFRIRLIWLLLALGLAGTIGFLVIRHFLKPEPYIIAVIQSSTEVTPEAFNAVKLVMESRLEALNEQGGINGRPLEVRYLDDRGDQNILRELVTDAVKNPDLIAIVGGLGIWRARTCGPIVTKYKVPYLGDYTYTQLATEFPTMYTIGLGVTEGRSTLIQLLHAKATRVGFIGNKGALNSQTFFRQLTNLDKQDNSFQVTYHKFFPKGFRYTDEELDLMADSLKKNVDFLIYTNEPQSFNPILKMFSRNQLQIPIFCGLIDLAQLDMDNPDYRKVELYDFNSFGIPGTHNKRLQEKLTEAHTKLQFGPKYEYQIGSAANLTDMVGIVTEAAKISALQPEAPVRERINEGLRHYINGQEIFRGWYADIYFTPEKASANTILVAWKPRNRPQAILAPEQYVLRDSIIQKNQVLYTNLDLVRLDQINDEDAAFMATFYLQLQSDKEIAIEQLDFVNAARNSINHEALIEARLVRSRKDTTGFGFYHYLFKVSGKFQFDPDLRRYPLDQQAFPISIQTSNALRPILIQPADLVNRDTIFDAKGWKYLRQFVGFDQEIISSSNAFSLERKNNPYYKFTFVYVMRRSSMDYFLKTLVPLFTILLIAYFSVYIPPREFEALAGIQVTALLSCIALYFSTNKPQIQYATISDKIFIFSYIMVTTLLGTSILIYILHRRNISIKKVALVYQRILFPLIVIGFSVYIRWF